MSADNAQAASLVVPEGQKPETADALASLASKRISERAAAARDFSLFGHHSHIPLLTQSARDDRSPAVRLCTAGAVADILSRHRIDGSSGEVGVAARQAFLKEMAGIDPELNAGLFNMLACLGIPAAFERIAMGLRDPRIGVRKGAAVGLRRLCASQSAAGDDLLEARVVTLLVNGRLPPDALAEVASVCAAVGFRSAGRHLMSLGLPRAHGEAVGEALAVLAGLDSPIEGIWCSDGRDQGEVNPMPSRGARLFLVNGQGHGIEETDRGWRKFQLPEDIRRMHVRPVGRPDAEPVLQFGGHTWLAARSEDLICAIERRRPVQDFAWAKPKVVGGALALARLAPLLDQDGTGLRALALLQAMAGQVGEAIDSLTVAVDARKSPPDVALLLAEAHLEVGKAKKAKPLLERVATKGRPRSAWYVHRAKALLGG